MSQSPDDRGIHCYSFAARSLRRINNMVSIPWWSGHSLLPGRPSTSVGSFVTNCLNPLMIGAFIVTIILNCSNSLAWLKSQSPDDRGIHCYVLHRNTSGASCGPRLNPLMIGAFIVTHEAQRSTPAAGFFVSIPWWSGHSLLRSFAIYCEFDYQDASQSPDDRGIHCYGWRW